MVFKLTRGNVDDLNPVADFCEPFGGDELLSILTHLPETNYLKMIIARKI